MEFLPWRRKEIIFSEQVTWQHRGDMVLILDNRDVSWGVHSGHCYEKR